MRSLGLDIGDKRIGLALSDPLGILATPLDVFERIEDTAVIAQILGVVARDRVELIIAGMPQSMDGSLGMQAEKVQVFVEKLRQASPVPVEYRDERLTTVEAKRMIEQGRAKKFSRSKKGEFDAAAAAVILQSYLNEKRPLEYPPE